MPVGHPGSSFQPSLRDWGGTPAPGVAAPLASLRSCPHAESAGLESSVPPGRHELTGCTTAMRTAVRMRPDGRVLRERACRLSSALQARASTLGRSALPCGSQVGADLMAVGAASAMKMRFVPGELVIDLLLACYRRLWLLLASLPGGLRIFVCCRQMIE